MKQQVLTRIAESNDAALLATLANVTFHDAFADHPLMPKKDLASYIDNAFTTLQIESELKDANSVFLLAEIDGELAGYAKLEFESHSPTVAGENPVKLKRLYARQKFIGRGVGASLLERCFGEGAERGHDTIWLTVWENNLRAQNFYSQWKFEPCGTIEFLLGEAVLTDLIMQRRVRLGESQSAG